jgi:hypothetical protein
MQNTRFLSWRRALPVIVVAAYLVGVGWFIARSAPIELYNRVNGGTIQFEVMRGVILSPWQCVTARWDVEGIEKVFFDDTATIGQADGQFCPYNANRPEPTLYIDFQGNFIQEFTIPVTVLTATRGFWASTLAALGLAWASASISFTAISASDGRVRRRLVAGLGVAAVLGALGATGLAVAAREPELITTDDGWVLREDEVRPQ